MAKSQHNRRVLNRSVDIHCLDGARMPSDGKVRSIIGDMVDAHPTDTRFVLHVYPGRYLCIGMTEHSMRGFMEE